MGGEAFIVLLEDIDREDLSNIAEKLRTLVENSHFTVGGKEVAVTISIGTTLAHQDDNVDSFLKRTDQNMYQSKLAGRNRVTMD